MRVKKLEIYGYGKWVDQTFDFNEGLQIIIGMNEAGKSTLMSFIHSIFFGFPTRNSTLLRYEPLESSRYGGKVIAEDSQLGEVIIERVHGKVTGDVKVTLEDGSTGSDDLLARILKGIDRENFQSIFSFSLTDIENVHQLDKNKLSRYLLNIGAHSTDYYLDLVDEFQKSAYNLYRPSGRIPPLNQELTIIKKQEQKLKKIEAQNESYLDLINQYNKENKEIEEREQKLSSFNKERKNLEELEKDLHLLEEIQHLENEISQTQLPYLKKDGPYLLEENKKNQREIVRELNDLRESIKNIQKDLIDPEKIDNYQKYEAEIKKLEEDLPDIVSEYEALKQIENQIQMNQKKKLLLQDLLKIPKNHSVLSSFSTEEKERVGKLLVKYNELTEELEVQEKELETLANKINQKNEKADYFEELMWEQEYLAEIEKRIKREVPSENPNLKESKSKGSTFLKVIGLGVAVSSLFTSTIHPLLLSSIGILLLITGFIYEWRNNKQGIDSSETSDESSEILKKEYQNQLNIQADWQNLLAEIDAVQRSYREKKDKIDERIQLQADYKQEWRLLLTNHGLPAIHPIVTANERITDVKDYIELKKEESELQKRQKKISEKLIKDFTLIEKITSDKKERALHEKIEYFRSYLRNMNQLIAREKEKMKKLAQRKERMKDLNNRKEKLALEKKHFFEATGVETEEDFYELYEKEKKLNQKKSRVEFLKENTETLNINADKEIPTKEELLSSKKSLEEKTNRLNEEIREKIDQRAKLKISIQNLEKDGRYSEALQEFESQKARTQNLVDEWISDKLAASIIQTTLNRVTKDRFGEIISEINRYFSYLTDGKYTNVLFKEEELFVQDKEGRVIEVKTLSRGTAEPLYVAVRLAYIIQLQNVIQLPIMMDDPFVNFDQKRKDRMHELLHNLSDQVQIIYFTFESSLKEEFTPEQIINLHENIN